MVIVAIDALDREAHLVADLTKQLGVTTRLRRLICDGILASIVQMRLRIKRLPHHHTVIAKVLLILWNTLETVACSVVAGVAFIAVQNLIGILISTAETNLAIRFEPFRVAFALALHWFDAFHVLLICCQHFLGLIRQALFEISKDRAPS